MMINVYFIHVSSDNIPNERCADEDYCPVIFMGRLNPGLLIIKGLIAFLMLRNFKEEIDEMRGQGLKKYLALTENVFDLGMIVCYLISLVFDLGEVASDVCILMY